MSVFPITMFCSFPRSQVRRGISDADAAGAPTPKVKKVKRTKESFLAKLVFILQRISDEPETKYQWHQNE